MNILITGAFGVLGTSILKHLVNSDHTIICLDLIKRRTLKNASKLRKYFKIYWGDIRNEKLVEKIISQEKIDLVVHLAYILPPITSKNYKYARSINVEGTRNLITKVKSQTIPPKVIFASSVSIYGDVREQKQPIKTDTKPNPVDEYAKMKVECMNLFQESGIDYSFFVFSVIVPIKQSSLDPKMFELPIDTKIEILHEDDAGLAVVNALDRNDIWKKTFHISGGPSCRVIYLDFIQNSMKSIGLGELPMEAFGGNLYHSAWMSSEESNNLLQYQNHNFQEILTDLQNSNKTITKIVSKFQRPIRNFLLNKSPYYKKNKRR
ncbi:MAG: NAD-dependent epimerase/dehydratase family protein [Candidatus Thorarchaeota archaeon]